jgi:two-component system response regulator MprA
VGFPNHTVLLVEDELSLANAVAAVLRHAGYSVLVEHSAPAALALLRSHKVDAIIADQFLPKVTGDQLLARLAASGHGVPAILITGAAELEDELSNKPGVSRVLLKPIPPRTLLAALAALLA